MKIRMQLLIGIVFMIILSITITAVVIVKDAKNLLLSEVDERGRTVITYLKGVTVDPLLHKDKITLISYIQEIASTPGVKYVIVTDKKDKIVASNNTNDIGKDVDKLYNSQYKDNRLISVRYENKNFVALNFTEKIEFNTGGKKIRIGKIYLGFDKVYIDKKIYGIYIKSAVIAVGIIVLSVLFMLFLTGKMITPLKELIKGTEAVATGNFDYRIKVNVKNEFQSLANSFNDMSIRLSRYYDGILNAFIAAIDIKDKYMPMHSKRVSKYAVTLANYLKLPQRAVENLRIACILMDIGNIGVESNVLHKKESLTSDDYIEIQKHPEIGAKILKNIDELHEIIPIVIQHHERYDGQGYPEGIKGEKIVVEARILAIVDAYDAMLTERQHRPAMPVEEALYELRQNKGKQFDPKIVEAFVGMINSNIK